MGIPLMQSMHCTGMGSYPQAAGSGQSGMLIPSCVVFTHTVTQTYTHTAAVRTARITPADEPVRCDAQFMLTMHLQHGGDACAGQAVAFVQVVHCWGLGHPE
jgi:hypothetical protein